MRARRADGPPLVARVPVAAHRVPGRKRRSLISAERVRAVTSTARSAALRVETRYSAGSKSHSLRHERIVLRNRSRTTKHAAVKPDINLIARRCGRRCKKGTRHRIRWPVLHFRRLVGCCRLNLDPNRLASVRVAMRVGESLYRSPPSPISKV
jgi:hypothetical protein